MTDMSIAHFGTTLIEALPAEDADQAAIPKTGDLVRTDEFLTMLGAQVYITNMYPGMGRQYIYKRGSFNDPDYFEKDTFTSYTAESLPQTPTPRIGETIFRLTHRDARAVAGQLMNAKLIDPKSSVDAFTHGETDRLFFVGPDQQQYELCTSTDQRAENHRIYIWTDPNDLAAHKQGYADHFNIHFERTEDFHGIGKAHLLVRQKPGITVALLTPNDGELSPKNSFDIFKDAGYSHFRLGAPDKAQVIANSTEAFPDGGGPVAFVHFQNSYLELVQISTET
jgi:hypothetical protein